METQKINVAYDVPPEMLEQLAEALPCLIPLYEEMGEGDVTVVFNGMVHLNLKVWEKKNCLDIKLHAFWKGTISILVDGKTALTLEIKNLHVLVHVRLCDCECLEHLIVNVHLNGKLTSDPMGIVDLNLKSHVIVHYVNGSLMFKIWLPDFLDLPLLEI